MKRTIIRYATLLALLGAAPRLTGSAGAAVNPEPPTREFATDSLQSLCGGRLPIYAAAGELWMEIPQQEIRLTVQIDQGAGMRNRPLRCRPTFRLVADPQTGRVRMIPDKPLAQSGFADMDLPLARIAGTERQLAGINRCLYESGIWYDCSGYTLRQRRYGQEQLLGIEPTTDGCLVRIGVWYDVEAPDRSTEFQMQSGALPLEIEIRIASGEPETNRCHELTIAANLPEPVARILNQAVDAYNRQHRHDPLQTVRGKEILPLTIPCGVSFDAVAERISTCSRRVEGQGTDFVRINLGSSAWERVALLHALGNGGSYRNLRRRLSDPTARRNACLRDSLVSALNKAFDPASTAPSGPQSEKALARELRNANRQFDRWNRFMQKDAARLETAESTEPVETIYRVMLDLSQRLYGQLADRSHGTSLEGEILGWIARGLIADEQGRFAAPLLRENARSITRREAARRDAAVWEQILATARPEALAGIEELFRNMLSDADDAVFTMQDAFVGSLLKRLPDHPQYLPVAEALKSLYDHIAVSTDGPAALFARIERQRLDKTENDNNM